MTRTYDEHERRAMYDQLARLVAQRDQFLAALEAGELDDDPWLAAFAEAVIRDIDYLGPWLREQVG